MKHPEPLAIKRTRRKLPTALDLRKIMAAPGLTDAVPLAVVGGQTFRVVSAATVGRVMLVALPGFKRPRSVVIFRLEKFGP